MKKVVMKKIFIIAVMFLSFQSFAQWPWEKIQGNGVLSKETRQVSNYSSIASSGSFDVMIAFGESNSIEVSGDENLIPYIETTVENGTLTIKSKNKVNLKAKNKLTIYVSLTRLTGISLSGSGEIIGDGNFKNEGQTDFKLSGSGKIKLNFGQLHNVIVNISGSGNIRLAGSAFSLDTKISGSGNADCSEVICEDAIAHISGSGNIKLNANKSINANISGSGNISYKGAANEIKKQISGSGRLVRS